MALVESLKLVSDGAGKCSWSVATPGCTVGPVSDPSHRFARHPDDAEPRRARQFRADGFTPVLAGVRVLKRQVMHRRIETARSS
jgi:hypothetical protein